jgi:TRAP-type C4-dicarboxylate transport system substrate-binding protein
MNALGANPQQMQWAETFSALQQGVVDGQENPIGAVIVPARVYEVQKYLTTWHYSYDPLFLGVSQQLWDSWDGDTQALMRTAAEEAMAFQVQRSRDQTATGIDFLTTQGMEIHQSTPEELEAFKAATQPAFDAWAERVGADLVALFQDTIAAGN